VREICVDAVIAVTPLLQGMFRYHIRCLRCQGLEQRRSAETHWGRTHVRTIQNCYHKQSRDASAHAMITNLR